jgi:putative transposase
MLAAKFLTRNSRREFPSPPWDRYGYRRIYILLRREGWEINHKRVYRLYREEGLQMRHKPPRRRVRPKLREDRCPATAPNECWSMDFMHDELFNGGRLRLLMIVDSFSRVSPAIGVKNQYHAVDVVRIVRTSCRIFPDSLYPGLRISDNG